MPQIKITIATTIRDIPGKNFLFLKKFIEITTDIKKDRNKKML